MSEYLKDVRTEMQRVTWPTPKETRKMSLVTIGVLVSAGIALWLTDTALVAILAILSKIG